jgi:hypothetical protein
VWALKQEFVREAIKLNPFGSDYYLWMDAGYIRDERMFDYLERPFCRVPELVPPGRLTVVEVYRIEDYVISMCIKDSIAVPWPEFAKEFGGGLLVGDVEAWNNFGKDFEAALIRYDELGYFEGDD